MAIHLTLDMYNAIADLEDFLGSMSTKMEAKSRGFIFSQKA
jgi:hypothetical protein